MHYQAYLHALEKELTTCDWENKVYHDMFYFPRNVTLRFHDFKCEA